MKFFISILISFAIIGCMNSSSDKYNKKSKYDIVIGKSFVELMRKINAEGKFVEGINFNHARIFRLNDTYLVSPVDYNNQYSIITEDKSLLDKWISSEKFPVTIIRDKSFYYELSEVEELNRINDSLAYDFLSY